MGPSRLAPTPALTPPPVALVFWDAVTGFLTTDVHDVHDEIVRFDTAGELTWTADGRTFPGFAVRGSNTLQVGDDWLKIHFGTRNGERRAYLGWDLEAYHCECNVSTIVDLEIVDGRVVIQSTDVFVPDK